MGRKRKGGWSAARRGAQIKRRNREVVARYMAGETRESIAEAAGISTRQVSRIVAQAKDVLPPDHREALVHAQLARPGSTSDGRPREIILPPEDMRFYRYLRQEFSAAYARQALGIAA